jgi:hypothetical protein
MMVVRDIGVMVVGKLQRLLLVVDARGLMFCVKLIE